jgi:hypothetical protein
MNKPVRFSPFMSIQSDACGLVVHAFHQALNRANALIIAFNTTISNDNQYLPCELINITTVKTRNGLWVAIALLKQGKWVQYETDMVEQ